jgi:Rab GDP dissociation inhibitor
LLQTDTNMFADDIKDIYRRAEGQELVVEGLREGSNFNVEE